MLKLFINKQPIMKCFSAYLIKYSHAYRNFDALRENENVKRVERQTFEKKLEFIFVFVCFLRFESKSSQIYTRYNYVLIIINYEHR